MGYANSSEKDKVRNAITIPLFADICKRLKGKPVVLELVDFQLESIQKYLGISPLTKVIGVTLGDQAPSNSPFITFEGKLETLFINGEFISSAGHGFDFANLDFYGPGRYFDIKKSSYNLGLFNKFFKFQKKKQSFGFVLTVDSFDRLPPRFNHKLAGHGEFVVSVLRRMIVPEISKYLSIRRKEELYERLLNVAGIIIDLSRIANKGGMYLSVYKNPYVYIGRSSGHMTPMITIAFNVEKGNRLISESEIIAVCKKTNFM